MAVVDSKMFVVDDIFGWWRINVVRQILDEWRSILIWRQIGHDDPVEWVAMLMGETIKKFTGIVSIHELNQFSYFTWFLPWVFSQHNSKLTLKWRVTFTILWEYNRITCWWTNIIIESSSSLNSTPLFDFPKEILTFNSPFSVTLFEFDIWSVNNQIKDSVSANSIHVFVFQLFWQYNLQCGPKILFVIAYSNSKLLAAAIGISFLNVDKVKNPWRIHLVSYSYNKKKQVKVKVRY